MNRNGAVRCDVKNCKHNESGCNCSLDCISVTCGCGENRTCCGDFSERE